MFQYYSSATTLLINSIFLFHITIAMLLLSNSGGFKSIYSSKWVMYYFLSICLLFLFFYIYKFVISLVFFDTLSFFAVPNKCFTTSYFSDTIICLSFITSFISWIYLSERFMYKTHFFIFYFFIFIVCTINMVTTSNLLVMFVFFEFIFLPSLFFVYQFAYSKKVDKTISYLLKWTMSGSLLVLIALIYIYSLYSTLDVHKLSLITFSDYENFFLFIFIFIGFGIKLPIWPFYYWLTKVHVEAPAGFSIFLSGFLVKTAFFCLAFFTQLLLTKWSLILSITILLWGCIDASIRMWTCTDIKKLIAFATIQEMNLIVLFLFISGVNNYSILSIFLLVHGVLSSLFFFLVDQVQKTFGTRNILSISGSIYYLPTLSTLVWGALLVFRGFPFFVKFFIEWEILSLFITNYTIFGAIVFIIISVFGVLGFSRIWFSVMYGQPQNTVFPKDMLRLDLLVGLFLFFFLISLSFVIFYF